MSPAIQPIRPGRGSRRCHRRDECGFTIIETIVSLSLIVISMSATAGVFYSSMRSGGLLARRTDGSALATREVEAMRAVPYAQAAFYADQTGFVSTFEGLTTVTAAAATPSGTVPQIQAVTPDAWAAPSFAPDPNAANATPVQIGGVSYTINRYLVWADASGVSATSTSTTTLYAQAYKRATVIINWTDQGGAHSVRSDSVLYPGGLGRYTGAGGAATTTTSTTSATCPVTLPVLSVPVVPAAPAGQTEVDLAWVQLGSAGVSSYTIRYATNVSMTGATNINNISNTATSYQVTPLGSGTTYWFEVVANCAGGASSLISLPVPATTQLVAFGCVITNFSITAATSGSTARTYQTSVHLHGNVYQDQMSENLSLALTTTGPCLLHTFSVSGVLHPTGPADGTYTLSSGLSGHWTATIASRNQPGWPDGVHDFTVMDNGSATSSIKSFLVCASGSQGAGAGC